MTPSSRPSAPRVRHPGVGGSFAAVHTFLSGHTLTTNYRQTDAVERRALELWRDQNYRDALTALAPSGRVHVAAQAIRRHNGELDPRQVIYDLLGGGTAGLHIGDIVLIREKDYRAGALPAPTDTFEPSENGSPPTTSPAKAPPSSYGIKTSRSPTSPTPNSHNE